MISVGNLVVGGAGKTPLVAHLARLLLAAGERPAILSRGYARQEPLDGIVVVRDAEAIRAGLAQSGDEPFMLARMLEGCAVLVARHRHLAGALAESRLGCTVHLLDDGFQHLELDRDLDLLIVRSEDLRDGRTLPVGRLRERASTAALADAWIGDAGDRAALDALAAQAGVMRVFAMTRELGPPAVLASGPVAVRVEASTPALLVSGLARPDQFEAAARAEGWSVVDHLAFPNHYRYRARDVGRIAGRVVSSGARVVLTSEKDAVRLEALQPLPFACATLPLRIRIEPAHAFGEWIVKELRRVRSPLTPAPSP